MSIEPKTLRALAKASGYPPSKIFRMQPSDIVTLLSEKFTDIGEWDDNRAKKELESINAKPDTKKETKEAVSTEKADKPKRTRRTKAQIAADKAAAEAAAQNTKPAEEPKKADEANDNKHTPRRQRRKKKTPVAASTATTASADIQVLKERLINIEDTLTKFGAVLDELTLFMTWYHNAKIDPQEPIESLNDIDWKACISDQLD